MELYFPWDTEYRPSRLALKAKGSRKAVVVRVSPSAALGYNAARIYDAYLGGVRVYDAAGEFRPGQVVELP